MIYLYVCRDCGHVMEETVLIPEDRLHEQECLECGGVIRRKFAVGGIVFKGSGFYSTDKRKPE